MGELLELAKKNKTTKRCDKLSLPIVNMCFRLVQILRDWTTALLVHTSKAWCGRVPPPHRPCLSSKPANENEAKHRKTTEGSIVVGVCFERRLPPLCIMSARCSTYSRLSCSLRVFPLPSPRSLPNALPPCGQAMLHSNPVVCASQHPPSLQRPS